MHLPQTNKQWVLIALFGAVVAGEAVFLFFPESISWTRSFITDNLQTRSFEKYADQIITACQDARYRPSCYDKEIPKLMDEGMSMEDAFRVTVLVQDRDHTYRYCHVLGHELSAREVRKDPQNWKDVLSRCPSGVCSNGCIHGGFQERFRKESFETDAEIESIKPDLRTVCESRDNWHPTGLEQASCYHAVGHLTMYVTNADIKKSIVLCDDVAKKPDGRDLRQLCYDGAFMQIFQPLEPEDFALIKGKEVTSSTVKGFCSQFTGQALSSCRTEAWPLYADELKTSKGITRYCGAAEPQERSRCYSALVYLITAQFNFDLEKIIPYCSGLDPEWRAQCFADAATRLIETDYRNASSSVALCRAATPHDPTRKCFNNLIRYSTYNFHKGSPAFYSFCNTLPEEIRNACLSREENAPPRNTIPVAE